MIAKKDVKKSRKQYSAEFKDQALKRAEQDGVARAAKDLGLAESQLYNWRQKKRQEGQAVDKKRVARLMQAKALRKLPGRRLRLYGLRRQITSSTISW